MARHRFVSSGQPLPLRVLLGLFEFLASSAVATIVISLLAVVLAWATWVESRYGLAAVQFGVYQSIWFAVLLAFLGVNVLAAALIRFPWRRHQIGFLIVHAGILILLVGCWISREKALNARLILYEENRSSQALGEEQQFELTVTKHRPGGDVSTETVVIPFRPGPFNWSDYHSLSWFPWHWVRRNQGIVYDNDGVRVEVLDYDSDSRRVSVPRLRLRFAKDMMLGVRELRLSQMPHRPLMLGSQSQFAARTVFRLAKSQAETAAFLDSRPEGSLGRLGQIVLHVGGEKYSFLVEDLRDKGLVPVGPSGLRVELARFDPAALRVLLKVYAKDADESSGVLLLNGFQVDLDQQDYGNGVFGSYWFAPSKKSAEATKDTAPKSEEDIADVSEIVPQAMAQAATEARVDILQGHDPRLYYRTWCDGRAGAVDRLPDDGSTVVVFDDTEEPVTLAVEEFLPAVKPGHQVIPLPFDKDKPWKQQRVKVRLTLDGSQRECWLADDLAPSTRDADESSAKVESGRRAATLRMGRRLVDLGFQVHLGEFERKLDPGTSRAAEYSSRVDFLSRDKKPRVLEKGVVISLNRPARFVDPTSGRVYRLFQTSFGGPYKPGDPVFDARVPSDSRREKLYRSELTVAYDPGRQLKYAGCLMIIAGIVVMYCMKAYFFEPRRKPETKPLDAEIVEPS
ncbi:MAG: hypothetical protein JW888_09990 [Pirellulales bacterium]|nr:hypothetical protein [Pirellulales bacterium]